MAMYVYDLYNLKLLGRREKRAGRHTKFLLFAFYWITMCCAFSAYQFEPEKEINIQPYLVQYNKTLSSNMTATNNTNSTSSDPQMITIKDLASETTFLLELTNFMCMLFPILGCCYSIALANKVSLSDRIEDGDLPNQNRSDSEVEVN